MRIRTLHEGDVGATAIPAFGRLWLVVDFIGRILPGDVGKRVYLVGDVLQVENNEQRDARMRQEVSR